MFATIRKHLFRQPAPPPIHDDMLIAFTVPSGLTYLGRVVAVEHDGFGAQHICVHYAGPGGYTWISADAITQMAYLN